MSGRFRRYRSCRRAGNNFKRYNSSKTSSVKKRARGNAKAAANQNDISEVIINLFKTCYTGVSACVQSGFGIEVEPLSTCAVNIYDLLRRSEFYKSYANMY